MPAVPKIGFLFSSPWETFHCEGVQKLLEPLRIVSEASNQRSRQIVLGFPIVAYIAANAVATISEDATNRHHFQKQFYKLYRMAPIFASKLLAACTEYFYAHPSTWDLSRAICEFQRLRVGNRFNQRAEKNEFAAWLPGWKEIQKEIEGLCPHLAPVNANSLRTKHAPAVRNIIGDLWKRWQPNMDGALDFIQPLPYHCGRWFDLTAPLVDTNRDLNRALLLSSPEASPELLEKVTLR
jgi:hypothetical protein